VFDDRCMLANYGKETPSNKKAKRTNETREHGTYWEHGTLLFPSHFELRVLRVLARERERERGEGETHGVEGGLIPFVDFCLCLLRYGCGSACCSK